MLVDDDSANRLILKIFLEDKYDASEAESGAKCLELIDSNVPDIFLLDINMPGMNGYELCAELRRRPETKSIPIIFVSGLETAEERLAGFEAGGNGFLTKPVQQTTLMEAVDYQIEHRKEFEDAQKNSEEAMQVAMEAMTSNSELGQMIQFVKDSHDENTLTGVGKKLC